MKLFQMHGSERDVYLDKNFSYGTFQVSDKNKGFSVFTNKKYNLTII